VPQWIQANALTIASIVIAACALGLTIWQGCMQRRHSRKSVLPIVEVIVRSGPDADGHEAGFYLRNSGIGPAILERITILYKGQPLKNASALMQLVDSHWKLAPTTPMERIWHTWPISLNTEFEGATILPGEEIYILKLRNESWKEGLVDALREILGDIVIGFHWRSIYGKKFKDVWLAPQNMSTS